MLAKRMSWVAVAGLALACPVLAEPNSPLFQKPAHLPTELWHVGDHWLVEVHSFDSAALPSPQINGPETPARAVAASTSSTSGPAPTVPALAVAAAAIPARPDAPVTTCRIDYSVAGDESLRVPIDEATMADISCWIIEVQVVGQVDGGGPADPCRTFAFRAWIGKNNGRIYQLKETKVGADVSTYLLPILNHYVLLRSVSGFPLAFLTWHSRQMYYSGGPNSEALVPTNVAGWERWSEHPSHPAPGQYQLESRLEVAVPGDGSNPAVWNEEDHVRANLARRRFLVEHLHRNRQRQTVSGGAIGARDTRPIASYSLSETNFKQGPAQF